MHRTHPPAGGAPDEARRRVSAFFSRHAEHYAQSDSHREGRDLERLVELLAPGPEDRALDVGTGAGHTAFRLAPQVACVVALDCTAAMAVPFRRLAAEKGLDNVRFQVGDAERLPFADAAFDLVTTRRAAHHFPSVEAAVGEMARVLRPGGRLGVADMTAVDGAAARLLNDLELARDGSHVRALTPDEWRALVERAGMALLALEVQEDPTPWERWLSPLAPDGPEAAEAERILRHAPPHIARLVAEERPDGRWVVKRRVVLVARR